MRNGVEISGKRRRMVVDDDEVFKRFSASCSRRLVSRDSDAVLAGEAPDDLNGV